MMKDEQPLQGSTGESDEIRARKQALRKEIRAKVRALSSDEISTQSEQVWEHLLALPEYQKARTIALFLSMPKNEIKTETVLRHCVEDGKVVYVPQVGANFECADMELLKVVDAKNESNGQIFYQTWPQNKWGIPEPPEDMPKEVAKPGDIDLVIVPGLGFDRRGNRIGQGKGYYDRWIARMVTTKDDDNNGDNDSTTTPLLVAVALDCQLVDSIPVSPLDRVMDKVLLPSQVIQVSKS